MTKHSQDTQKEILRHIAENPLITLRELAAKEPITCSLSTINYHIAELTENGYLLRPQKQRRGFVVTDAGYKCIRAKVIVCKCCGHSYLKLLDEN